MIALLAGLIAGPYLSGQQGYVRVETQTPYMKCHSPH